jgi:AcrR family transcriptional regulator
MNAKVARAPRERAPTGENEISALKPRTGRSVGRPAKRIGRVAPDAKAPRGENVEVMLNAAHDVLAEEGYRGFTLRKIAERSGVSLGTLTYHFKDRASLIDGICRRHVQRWQAALDKWGETEAHSESPEAYLKFLLARHLSERFSVRAYRFDAELWAMSMRSDDAWNVLQNAANGMLSIYADAILKINPGWTLEQATSRATMIWTLIEGLPILTRADRIDLDATAVRAEVETIVLLMVKQG